MASNRMIAGAALAVVGAIFSVTGIGLIVGIPTLCIGIAIMFPRSTVLIAILGILAFFLYFGL